DLALELEVAPPLVEALDDEDRHDHEDRPQRADERDLEGVGLGLLDVHGAVLHQKFSNESDSGRRGSFVGTSAWAERSRRSAAPKIPPIPRNVARSMSERGTIPGLCAGRMSQVRST